MSFWLAGQLPPKAPINSINCPNEIEISTWKQERRHPAGKKHSKLPQITTSQKVFPPSQCIGPVRPTIQRTNRGQSRRAHHLSSHPRKDHRRMGSRRGASRAEVCTSTNHTAARISIPFGWPFISGSPFFSRAIIITDILGSHRKSSSRAPLHCMAVDPDSGLVWEVIGEVINVPTDLTTTTPWDDGEMRCGSKLLKRNVPRANKLSCLL